LERVSYSHDVLIKTFFVFKIGLRTPNKAYFTERDLLFSVGDPYVTDWQAAQLFM